MNNLKQQNIESIVSSDLLFGVKCLTIDTDLNVIYGVNTQNQLISIDLNNHSMKICCHMSGSDDSSEAICVQFLSEERSVCIALTNGQIVRFDTMTSAYETVGSLSGGLESVAFSLDEELIVLLTQNNSLLLMNKLFDVLAQKHLKTDEFGCHQSVSVNWGSKETQFHGQGMRDKRTIQEDSKSFSHFDDRKSRISWRADGLYFMTSCFDSKTNCRKLQVWSRDAILQYTSEYINGLEHLISWKPSGALIASSQLLANKHMIVFIEKNGLKHGEFELPFRVNAFQLELILWSNDSKILLILGTESMEETKKQILMLWRQTNYKWDLKQRLEFRENSIETAFWDPMDATLLHLVLSNGSYMRYRWKWSIDVSDSEANVALIDGNRLKLTDFERSVIPPPFFSYSFDFETQILEMCFSDNKCAVILIDETIYLFEKYSKSDSIDSKGFSISYENTIKESDEIYKCFSANKCPGISSLTNCVIDKNGVLYGVHTNQLFGFDFRNEFPKLMKRLDINCNVLAVSCLDSTIGIVANDGKLLRIDLNDYTIKEWTDSKEKAVIFAQQCSRLQLIAIESTIHAICLSENFSLYIDNEVLSQNCNSFIKFKDTFILFATTDHLLHCWPINGHILDVSRNYSKYSPRSVERGSMIIAVASDGEVVLQTPRGNLEAIYPRPLLLDLIMFELSRLEFGSAFELLRKHRINLNFIYDYKPNDFINYIQLFIEQIGQKSVDWICLFLTDVSNEDFFNKLCIHPNEHKLTEFRPKVDSINKIDLICESMRTAMDSLDPIKYFHPILLTYVRKSVSELDKALKRIKAIEDTVVREKAIKFLLYIININTLFDEALGTYDSDIFLMIASKSQKDPKEYLALLDELNKISSIDYKCFKIDFYLKRYKKALTHISKSDEHFEECLQLIRTHSLYKDSVVLFEKSCDEKKDRVWKQYAEYLFHKKYFEESAIAFKRSHDFVNAVKAYQLSGNWSAAVDSALQCESDSVNVETVARISAKHLIAIGRHFEASYLLEVYAKDINESIKTLISGHEWEHTVRLISQSTESEQHLDDLKTELIKHFLSIGDIIDTNFDVLVKHMNRLEIVRRKQRQRTQELKSFDNFDDKSDIYSETSSLSDTNTSSQRSTSSSLATKKSRKSTKKLEKKKFVLKEGSVDEDLQLIYAIHEMIKELDRMQEEVTHLIRTLYNFYFSNEAKKIQTDFDLLLDLIKKIIKQIWNQSEQQNQTEESTQKYRISEPEIMKAPELRQIDWKLALI